MFKQLHTKSPTANPTPSPTHGPTKNPTIDVHTPSTADTTAVLRFKANNGAVSSSLEQLADGNLRFSLAADKCVEGPLCGGDLANMEAFLHTLGYDRTRDYRSEIQAQGAAH